MSGLVEYRVVWKREGLKRKTKRCVRLAKADGLAALLRARTAAEVLKLRGVDPEALNCCSGRECGCGGETNLEREEAYRDELPPLEYCFVEERTIGEWRAPLGCPKCGEES